MMPYKCSICGAQLSFRYFRRNPEHLCTACLQRRWADNIKLVGGNAIAVRGGLYAIVIRTRSGIMWTGLPIMDSQELRRELYGDRLPIGTLLEYWNPQSHSRRMYQGDIYRVIGMGDALALERVAG